MKLSILICSLDERLDKLSILVKMLEQQAKDKPVEILWLGDNRSMTVGEKRNKLLQLAKGDYVSFIDDDDRVSEHYIDKILAAAKTNPDVICFECLFHNMERGIKNRVYFGRQHLNENYDEQGIRYRMPNHLCAVKREIALKAGFTEKNFGEDQDYGVALRNKFLLHSEVVIPEILYYYDFNPKTSATWQYAPSMGSNQWAVGSHKPMIKMDVVIVSKADDKDLKRMTQGSVNTFRSDETNIIVMEKIPFIKYNHADTILQPEPFNYNRCLNTGAIMGNAEFICFSNNDVAVNKTFTDDVIREMKEKNLDIGGIQDHRGYFPKDCITGWCFIMRRDAWLKIGKLNEDYPFYCADNIVWKQAQQHNLKYGVLESVYCYHGISATKNRLDASTCEEYTTKCVKKFNKENHTNLLNLGI